MTSPAWHSRAARDEAGKHETVTEPVPAGVQVAAWIPPDPETLRRVKAALDRL
jgi:hypothetical protein